MIVQNILGITWIISSCCYLFLIRQSNKTSKRYFEKLKEVEKIREDFINRWSGLNDRERVFKSYYQKEWEEINRMYFQTPQHPAWNTPIAQIIQEHKEKKINI